MSVEEMEDNENREDQLVNDGQVPENSPVESEMEHRQEVSLPASIPDDQNPSEVRSGDDNSKENVAEDENRYPVENGDDAEDENPYCVENGDEEQNLWNDEQQPMMEDHQVEEEQVDVPDEPDKDEDDSESTEVMENGIETVDAVAENKQDPVTPSSPTRCSNAITGDDRKGISNNWLESEIMEDDEDGSPEEQAAFMKELECFYKERGIEFKPPKFYQQPLNCLKLWRAVVKLGGYDLVTGTKLWRQVGISFHPPKTCTTVSWTFRNFYEKALLEYERYKSQNGELQFSAVPESSSVDNANGYQGPGLSCRTKRDAASRAMQGWHVQKLFEVGEPAMKDKNFNNMPKREKSLRSIGSVKHKRPGEMEHTVKAARTEIGKQLVVTVEDAGPPADWVKINVLEAEDCFEVYALVPGLLREEVRVQSDPAGRLVITGQPEQPDNPWGINAFRKVVTLPARIDPLQTSAVVSLHGRLYVRVPFEESDI